MYFFSCFFHLKFGFLKLFNYICLVRLFERIKKKIKKKYTKIWIFQKIMLYLKCKIKIKNYDKEN